jgi:hypothetical protein
MTVTHKWDPNMYEDWRMVFISEVVDRYIQVHPLDDEGNVHVGMVRLEVEAEKNGIEGDRSKQ